MQTEKSLQTIITKVLAWTLCCTQNGCYESELISCNTNKAKSAWLDKGPSIPLHPNKVSKRNVISDAKTAQCADHR